MSSGFLWDFAVFCESVPGTLAHAVLARLLYRCGIFCAFGRNPHTKKGMLSVKGLQQIHPRDIKL